MGNCSSSDNSSGELTRNTRLPLKEGDVNSDIQTPAGDENTQDSSVEGVDQTQSEHASLVSLNDADDEFFDVLEPSDSDDSENGWMADCSHKKSPVKSCLKLLLLFQLKGVKNQGQMQLLLLFQFLN